MDCTFETMYSMGLLVLSGAAFALIVIGGVVIGTIKLIKALLRKDKETIQAILGVSGLILFVLLVFTAALFIGKMVCKFHPDWLVHLNI